MQVTLTLRYEDGVCRSEEGDKRPQVGNGTWEGVEVGSPWHNQEQKYHVAGGQ